MKAEIDIQTFRTVSAHGYGPETELNASWFTQSVSKWTNVVQFVSSVFSETAQKSIEKDTQSYLTNMNQPLLLLLFLHCLVAIKMTGAEHQTSTSAFMANALWLKKYSMSPLAWNSIKWNTSKPTVANQAVHFSALTNFVAQRWRRSVITSKRIRSWIRHKAANGRVTASLTFCLQFGFNLWAINARKEPHSLTIAD